MYVDISAAHVVVTPMLDKEVIPLRLDSGHHPHVHCGWPAAVVNRAFNLAAKPCPSHAVELIQKYVQCNASAFSLSLMRQSVANRNRRQGSRVCIPSHRSSQARPYRLKLGFHPALPKVVSLALKLKAPNGIVVKTSWKNRLPSLLARIGGHNRPLMNTRSNGWLLG